MGVSVAKSSNNANAYSSCRSLDLWTRYLLTSGDFNATNPCFAILCPGDCVLVDGDCDNDTLVCPPQATCATVTVPTDEPPMPCADITDQNTCSDREDCQPIFATACDSSEQTPEFVGCMEHCKLTNNDRYLISFFTAFCLTVLSCGISPEGESYYFPSSCIPEGWKSGDYESCCIAPTSQGQHLDCKVGDTVIPHGGSYFDGCNTCFCEDGLLACTEMACESNIIVFASFLYFSSLCGCCFLRLWSL